MPTADLINLNTLVLTDTFNTWLNRTNQIIDSINPIQIFDVAPGSGTTAFRAGGGLATYTNQGASDYNGLVVIGINPGPGVGFEELGGTSVAVVDFSKFSSYGRVLSGLGVAGAATRVANADEYIVNDISDSGGKSKKVQARHMLPPELVMDLLTISGDVLIGGNLNVQGTSNIVGSSDLRIEDKQIELAYQSAIIFGMTGVTSGSFSNGITAYYFPGPPGVTTVPAFYANVVSFTAGAGGTGTLIWGSPFQRGYDADSFTPGNTGFLTRSSTGANLLTINEYRGTTNSFFTDPLLDGGGIVLKGASGDKSILWEYTDADTGEIYNAWTSNVNFAVQGNENSIISRVHRSFGYTGVTASQFLFLAEDTTDAEIILGQISNETPPFAYSNGTWKIAKKNATNELVFSVGVGTTGITSTTQSFTITPGPSGPTYSGVTTYNYAKNLNVDMLDGANASLTAAAYTIPIANEVGKINGDFLDSDSVRRRYTQANHGLTTGMAVRIDTATSSITAAYAQNDVLGEAFGIVSAVHSTSEFTVTHQGRIDGLSGGRSTLESVAFVPGEVYFLGASASVAARGKLTVDPDGLVYSSTTRLNPGNMRKAMLLALSATQGYVLNHPGNNIAIPTDTVSIGDMVPIATIQAYGGNPAALPYGWLLCDGRVYRATDYPDLYNIIGRQFTAPGYYDGGTLITFTINLTSTTGYGGNRGLDSLSFSNLRIELINDSGTVYRSSTINTADDASSRITLSGTTWTNEAGTTITAPTPGNYRIRPYNPTSLVFFVPDLRSRSVVGPNSGTGYGTPQLGNTISILDKQIGGVENVTLNRVTVEHQHNVATRFTTYASLPVGGTDVLVTGVTGVQNTITAVPFSVRNNYLATNFIIRAVRGSQATILTGHNHNGYHHLLNSNVFLTGPADPGFLSVRSPTGGWSVIASTGVANNTNPFTALSVMGFTAPAFNFSTTQVHMRGDLTVYANGITTSSVPNFVSGESFLVQPNISRVSIYGGTGSASSINRPAPVLRFVNGASNTIPIGTIEGLTLPVSDNNAANKRYTDTADKVLYSAGVYREPPGTRGYGGAFNVLAARSLIQNTIGLGYTAYICSAFWDPSPTDRWQDSHNQFTVHGDLTVFGDGQAKATADATGNSTPITRPIFYLDPLYSNLTIAGTTAADGRTINRRPRLTLGNFDRPGAGGAIDPSVDPIGSVDGLTYPTYGHQAVNYDSVKLQTTSRGATHAPQGDWGNWGNIGVTAGVPISDDDLIDSEINANNKILLDSNYISDYFTTTTATTIADASKRYRFRFNINRDGLYMINCTMKSPQIAVASDSTDYHRNINGIYITKGCLTAQSQPFGLNVGNFRYFGCLYSHTIFVENATHFFYTLPIIVPLVAGEVVLVGASYSKPSLPIGYDNSEQLVAGYEFERTGPVTLGLDNFSNLTNNYFRYVSWVRLGNIENYIS
jgi:microcystin-dependent protein